MDNRKAVANVIVVLCAVVSAIAASEDAPDATSTRKTAFDSNNAPPKSEFNASFEGEEQYFWDGRKWLTREGLRVDDISLLRIDDKWGGVGYVVDRRIVYLWKDLYIPIENKIFENPKRPVGELVRAGAVVEVEQPVQFYKDKDGKFRPCFYDSSHHHVFLWKDVIVPENQIPAESPEHRAPVIDPKVITCSVIEVEIPKYMLPVVKKWVSPTKK